MLDPIPDIAQTIWIAKLIGPIIVVLSVPMIIKPAALEQTTRQFLEDRPLILVSGVLAMLAGLAIVNTHNVWVFGWPLIVTLFGWGLVLGGAARVIAPGVVHDVGGAMMGQPELIRVAGVSWAALGAYLTFEGYA